MNFLLYMLGRAHQSEGVAALRPSPRRQLLARAAGNAVRGEFREAAALYARLGRNGGMTPVDRLVRGHLYLTLGRLRAAQRDFIRGSERLLTPRDSASGGDADNCETSPSRIECLFTEANDYLARGRYARAIDLLQQARTLLDILLSAQAGLALIEWRLADRSMSIGASPGASCQLAPAVSSLISLGKLGDFALRFMARVYLAMHFAEGLRRRAEGGGDTRTDLAAWATSGSSLDTLLALEVDRLSRDSHEMPGRAEGWHRLGLVASACGRHAQAGDAFGRALALHPHHMGSASRLAAIEAQAGRVQQAAAVLERALRVAPPTLALFAALAESAGRGSAFDGDVDCFCGRISTAAGRHAARANLAFAMAEVVPLNPLRAGWREASPA